MGYLQQLVAAGRELNLPESFVITGTEKQQIQQRISEYNAAGAAAVVAYNRALPSSPAKLIDAAAGMRDLQENGAAVSVTTPSGTVPLNLTTLLFGGLFSLDGLHPSNTGYAVIANWFIDGLNASMPAARRIPRVNVSTVASTDPFVSLWGPAVLLLFSARPGPYLDAGSALMDGDNSALLPSPQRCDLWGRNPTVLSFQLVLVHPGSAG